MLWTYTSMEGYVSFGLFCILEFIGHQNPTAAFLPLFIQMISNLAQDGALKLLPEPIFKDLNRISFHLEACQSYSIILNVISPHDNTIFMMQECKTSSFFIHTN